MSTVAPAFSPSFSPSSNPVTDPFGWALGAAVNGSADTLITILSGVWQAGLWLLELAFRLVDAFTTPDLTANGPMGYVLPITLWLGGFVALVMFFVQLGLALVRRDGQSIGRVFLGLAQFAIVWASFVVVGAGVVAAASGLTHGILSATLDVDVLASWEGYRSWPREGVDVASAFVLAITSLLLLIPAAFTDVLVALVREAALIVLTAVAPIAAAGLLSDVSRAWFWKSLRWFLSAAFIAPGSALVLGIGVRVSNGVIAGAATTTAGGTTEATTSTAAAVGTGVVGAALVAVAAIAPLTLFRLMSFVEPSTVSGAAMRQAWADFSSLGRAEASSGGGSGGAAAASDGAGRAQGEAAASSATESRVSSALGMFGRGMQLTTSIANRAVDLSTDILGSAGVGHPGYSMTPADERALRSSSGSGGGGGEADGPVDPATPSGPAPGTQPGSPGAGGPAPSGPSGAGGAPPGSAPPGGGAAGGGAGGAAAAGAGAGAAGSVPVVVP